MSDDEEPKTPEQIAAERRIEQIREGQASSRFSRRGGAPHLTRQQQLESAQGSRAETPIAYRSPARRSSARPKLPSAWEMDRDDWPIGSQSLVFLGTAVVRLGRAVHGDSAWNAPATERITIGRLLVEACADEALSSFAKVQGRDDPLRRLRARSVWLTDDWRPIIEACAIHVPQTDLWTPGGPAWIFVDGDQLTQLVEKRAATGLGEPIDWRPLRGEQKTAWVNGRRWVAEVRRRLGAAGIALTNRAAGRVLAAMWKEARGEVASETSFAKMIDALDGGLS